MPLNYFQRIVAFITEHNIQFRLRNAEIINLSKIQMHSLTLYNTFKIRFNSTLHISLFFTLWSYSQPVNGKWARLCSSKEYGREDFLAHKSIGHYCLSKPAFFTSKMMTGGCMEKQYVCRLGVAWLDFIQSAGCLISDDEITKIF